MADVATEGLSHALEAERAIEPGGNLRASWEALLADARKCTRCDLYRYATQTVFGEGPLDASIMFVGEQPGDQEDLAGVGLVVDPALAACHELEMLDGVGDVDCPAVDARFLERGVE